MTTMLEKKLGINYAASGIDHIKHPLLGKYNLRVMVKRDDLLHPIITGNKWRKLKYILEHALSLDCDHLISMGGAYSNHLHALAWVGYALNLKTSAFIRGEQVSNRTLEDCREWGMELIFVSRSEYRELRQFKTHDSVPAKQLQGYWIPEGGSNSLALQGMAEIYSELSVPFTTMMLALGTGTSMAGLLNQLPDDKKLLGIACLKGEKFLEHDIQTLSGIAKSSRWRCCHDYHFGGFAKQTDSLRQFVENFNKQQSIKIEAVYTGKLFYALFDLIEKNYFDNGEDILVLHSGGIRT